MSSTVHPHVYELRQNQEEEAMKTMKLRRVAVTLIGVLAMVATSVNAGTTKKGYVFSDQPLYIPEYMGRIKGHDLEGAMRMIKEKKVYPLKEGLDVVIVEVIQGGIVRFRLRSTPVGFLIIKGTHYTAIEAIQQ
jgi:hypothetical protein